MRYDEDFYVSQMEGSRRSAKDINLRNFALTNDEKCALENLQALMEN
jgi:hypothetical protein